MNQEGYVQKELFDFAMQMNKIIKANDSEKGDSWKYMDTKELLNILEKHLDKLIDAVYRDDKEAIVDESTDVANICMMIYSHAKPPELERK
jgi:hypothetical protein